MAASMQPRIWPASLPPPMASNARVAPVSARAWVRSSMKVGELELHTYLAPRLRSRSSWSCLRTMLTRAMPSFWQILLSIWPRLEAAAVCTRALWPSMRMVSTMLSEVRGLTKHDAPSAGVVPSGSSMHWAAARQRYCEYIAPPMAATVLPSSACACGEEPAFTTTPAPSLPTGIDSSSRAFMAGSTRSGTVAVTTGRSAVPDALAVLMSAAPNSRPRSDGFNGDASTRITTSWACGSGMGSSCSESSSSPLERMRERIWSAMEEPFWSGSRMAFGHGAASIGVACAACWRLQDTAGTAGAWASASRMAAGSIRSM